MIEWDAVWKGDTSSLFHKVCEFLEVVSVPGCGRGVRTRVPLAAGDLLLCEQAIAIAPEAELARTLVGVQPSLSSWSQACLALMCDGGADDPQNVAQDAPIALRNWPGTLKHAFIARTVPEERMRSIVDLNAYRCSPPISEYAFMDEDFVPQTEEERHQTYGLFLLGSLVNHSCAPNVSKVLLGDWVFLRAAKDIAAGEELTQFYCDIRMPVQMRQQELQRDFVFSCSCSRCQFEESFHGAGGNKLKPWSSLYSNLIPGYHVKANPLQLSRLEGLIAEAENSAKAVLSSCASFCERVSVQSQPSKVFPNPETQQQWILWPLVPALSQLAARLCMDGRLSEGLMVWRKSEQACKAVLPYSNVHLKALSELLLSAAEFGGEPGTVEKLTEESLNAVNLAYGGSIQVWNDLVGFRMPKAVVHAAEQVHAELKVANLAHIDLCWNVTECVDDDDPVDERKRATLKATCAVFENLEDINFSCSDSALVLSAPGAIEQRVAWPFRVNISLLRPKFHRRRHCLELAIVEET